MAGIGISRKGKLVAVSIILFILLLVTASSTGTGNYSSNNTQSTSGGGLSSSSSFNISVTIPNMIGKSNSSSFKNYFGPAYARNFTYSNTPPTIDTAAVTSATQNSTYTYDVNASDEDGEVLSYSLLTKLSGMSITGNTGIINWTPSNEQVGLNNVTVMVTDTHFNVTQSFTINVSNINDAPLIHSSAYSKAYARRPYNYTLNATDPDNDNLTYSVNSAKFSSQSNFFNWTPSDAEIGQHMFNFSVSDGNIAVYEIANITVYNFTGPVMIKNISNQTWNEDTILANAFDLDSHFVDATGDTLTYNFSGNQTVKVTIDSANNVSFTPRADWFGTENVVFSAYDGNVTAYSNNVTLTVLNTPDCGDGNCEGNESCSSCASDCGACPSVSIAGSGVEITEAFSLDRDLIMASVKQGSTTREYIKVSNTGTAVLDFSIDASELSGFVLESDKKFKLVPLQSKTIALDFFASESEKPDVYTGHIIVRGGTKAKSIGVIIDVLPKTAIFDIKARVLDASKYAVKGDEVAANITMLNLGDLKPVDVELYYSIKDLGGNVLAFATETLAINDQASIARKLKMPEAALGDYVFYAKMSYTNQTASSGDLFHVVDIKPTCSDGIQNQGEQGIDCGGVCASCPQISVPKGKGFDFLPIAIMFVVLLIISSATFASISFYRVSAFKKTEAKESFSALKGYILSELAKDCKKPQIESALRKAGWNMEVVEKAFMEVLREALGEVKERDADRIEEIYIRMLEMGYTKEEAGKAVDSFLEKNKS